MKNQPPEFAGKVLDALSSHIAVLDADGVIIGVNDAWRRFCEDNGGVTRNFFVRENYLTLCERAAGASHDGSIAPVCKALREILAGQLHYYSQEYPCNSPTQERWFVLHITRCKGDGLIRAVVAHEDITKRKKAEMALARAEAELTEAKRALELANAELVGALSRAELAAHTDDLTGLSNRRDFFDSARRLAEIARRYPQPLSLVLFDVDRFKDINDHHGHPVGDQALVHVAQILSLQRRAADVLARYGGEEFVVLLPEASLDEAMTFAERARAAIESSGLVVGGRSIPVTVSAGVATMGPQVDTLEKLIQSADEALYVAKMGGRNQVRASR